MQNLSRLEQQNIMRIMKVLHLAASFLGLICGPVERNHQSTDNGSNHSFIRSKSINFIALDSVARSLDRRRGNNNKWRDVQRTTE